MAKGAMFCLPQYIDSSAAIIFRELHNEDVSADGKAMKFYEVAPFALYLTPETVRAAARTLSTESDLEAELR